MQFARARQCAHLLLAVLISISSTSAWAAPHHCGDRVQMQPCDFSFHQPKRRVFIPTSFGRHDSARAEFAVPRGGLLTGQSFSRVARGRGIWRGYLSGDGSYRLELRITRGAVVAERRDIGNLIVTPRDGPVRYTFEAPLPQGNNWSWQVVVSRL